MCYHASFNFPAFVLVFGEEDWPKFQTLYHKLSKMQDSKIKKTLASSIHELAKILGPKYTEHDLLPVLERFLNDKETAVKSAAFKNLHIFLKEVSPDKRQVFIKYIFQLMSDIRGAPSPDYMFQLTGQKAVKSDWRLKVLLAQNLGNYASLFDAKTVYSDFLPMFFMFLADNVVRVGQEAAPALVEFIQKFNDDEIKQAGIVRVVRNRYFKSKTYKKRQFFV